MDCWGGVLPSCLPVTHEGEGTAQEGGGLQADGAPPTGPGAGAPGTGAQ